MKKILPILLAGAAVLAVSCNNTTKQSNSDAQAQEEGAARKSAIVYFNLDRILEEYDMANDLRSVAETKVQSIQQEVNRRGSRLERDMKDFQEKLDKGLLIRSVAEQQGQKLQQRQAECQQYAAQKQQEIAEEQQVLMNQIADAVHSFLESYNEEKGYALILTTQGALLPAPVACGDKSLDITDDILTGLNAAYVKEKGKGENK